MTESADSEMVGNPRIVVHRESDGSLWGEVPELPGCFATGDTLEELCDALEEAITLYLARDSGELR